MPCLGKTKVLGATQPVNKAHDPFVSINAGIITSVHAIGLMSCISSRPAK